MDQDVYSFSNDQKLFFFKKFPVLHGVTTSYFGDCSKGRQRERIKKLVSADDIFGLTVEHGSRIRLINEKPEEKFPRCDGLFYINNNESFRPVIVSAIGDCPTVFFTTESAEIIGNVHSGRESTFQNIAGMSVRKLVDYLRIPVKRIQTAIFTGIGPCCYNRLNLGEIIYGQLIAAGVLKENIIMPNLCSAHHLSDKRDFMFFSHRRDGNGERNHAFITV
jgi:copper oxidase (laccase) domain-containing protein